MKNLNRTKPTKRQNTLFLDVVYTTSFGQEWLRQGEVSIHTHQGIAGSTVGQEGTAEAGGTFTSNTSIFINI